MYIQAYTIVEKQILVYTCFCHDILGYHDKNMYIQGSVFRRLYMLVCTSLLFMMFYDDHASDGSSGIPRIDLLLVYDRHIPVISCHMTI